MFKIGVMLDSLRMPLREGVEEAARLGAEGLQLYTVAGAMAPGSLTGEGRKQVRKLVKENGLEISALCGDLGGHGFTVKEDNRARIDKTKRIIELAHDLGSTIVTTHIGVITKEPSTAREAAQAACAELGEFAAAAGVCLAVETGPEKIEILKEFLDSLGNRGVRVNYDPANLVMVTGVDPVAGLRMLGPGYVVHTHAKDGRMKQRTEPAKIYALFAEGGIDALQLTDYFVETPLGEGDVDFPRYLRALKDIGYDGYLTIEREVGENPVHDIAAAVRYLQSAIASI